MGSNVSNDADFDFFKDLWQALKLVAIPRWN